MQDRLVNESVHLIRTIFHYHRSLALLQLLPHKRSTKPYLLPLINRLIPIPLQITSILLVPHVLIPVLTSHISIVSSHHLISSHLIKPQPVSQLSLTYQPIVLPTGIVLPILFHIATISGSLASKCRSDSVFIVTAVAPAFLACVSSDSIAQVAMPCFRNSGRTWLNVVVSILHYVNLRKNCS